MVGRIVSASTKWREDRSAGTATDQPGTSLPPILLTRAGFGGTLGAARCLGRHGVPVQLAGAHLLDPARWSRWARTVAAPADPEALVTWLLEEAPPGLVVYGSCDDLAWVLSRERETLSRRHHLYSPPLAALEAVLDKRRLHALAGEVGLRTPATWYPVDEAEALRLAPGLPYPVLLKPRTQVLSLTRSKGLRVNGPEELGTAWRAACAQFRFAPSLLSHLPEAAVPMIQAYHRDRADRILTISGFVDETQRHFVARASRKILQSPRGLGVGIGFDSRPLDPALAAAVQRLCAAAGFYGVFDVELLGEVEPLLIDFNPRLYNQVSFEVARGLPSPWLVYLGATGRREELAVEVARARAVPEQPGAIYCNRFTARFELAWQVLTGAVPLAEERRWRSWYASHRGEVTDPYVEQGDPGPQLAQGLSEIAGMLRHPRAFLRKRILGKH